MTSRGKADSPCRRAEARQLAQPPGHGWGSNPGNLMGIYAAPGGLCKFQLHKCPVVSKLTTPYRREKQVVKQVVIFQNLAPGRAFITPRTMNDMHQNLHGCAL